MRCRKWLARAAGAFLLTLSLWVGENTAQTQLTRPVPCPNACVPSVRTWGYSETRWRQWPGPRPLDQTNPRALGAEVLPTPSGSEILPLPKAAPREPSPPTPEQPTQPADEPILPPLEGKILPPEGTILPPEGTILPPGGTILPPEGTAPSTPGTQPSEPDEGALPGLPPEPDHSLLVPPASRTTPAEKPEEKAPKASADVPKLELKAEPKPEPKSSESMLQKKPPKRIAGEYSWPQTRVGREVRVRAAADDDVVATPFGVVTPERIAALPGAYRADSIATAPSSGGVEPTGYSADSPVAVAIFADAKDIPSVALNGYCPVELCRNGRWVAGDLRWTVVHQGRIYRLSGTEQWRQFSANPDAFAPVKAGADVVVSVNENRVAPGQPAYCATYNGRLYMFSSPETQAEFNRNPQRYAVP